MGILIKENNPQTDHRNLAGEIISYLFIVLFVYAAANKIMDYQKFLVQLGQSPILTADAHWISWLIPLIEVIISVMLCVSTLRLYALYASLGLMSMFCAYIIAILKFTQYVPCSCGGILEKMGWGQHLIFNLLFVGLAALAIVIEHKNRQHTF